MKILAIDTALSNCSAAIWEDGEVLGVNSIELSRGHVEVLMPMIKNLMAKTSANFSDIDMIAVTIGPGSFTGMRTGLSAAHGLALALNIPVHGVTTFEAVAFSVFRQLNKGAKSLPLFVVLETKRADFYFQQYTADGSPQNEPIAALPEAIIQLLPNCPIRVAGDACDRFLDAVPENKIGNIKVVNECRFPFSEHVAEIAGNRVHSAKKATPFYIHPPAAKLPYSN